MIQRHLSVLNEEMRTVFECTIPYDMWPGPGNATKVEIKMLVNRDQARYWEIALGKLGKLILFYFPGSF